jgi:hypothetical protein
LLPQRAGPYSRYMPSLASTLVAPLVTRAARLIRATYEEPALWTITVDGCVVGSLVCEAGAWRLSWFDGADPRLAAHAGRGAAPPDGDVDALAEALSARIGAPVRLEQLPV